MENYNISLYRFIVPPLIGTLPRIVRRGEIGPKSAWLSCDVYPALLAVLHAILSSDTHLRFFFFEKGTTAAWRSPNGGGNSKMGWELQNRTWLPSIRCVRLEAPQPDLTRQWHLFRYTQRHYPIIPSCFRALGLPHCLKQSDRVKSLPCAVVLVCIIKQRFKLWSEHVHKLWALLSWRILIYTAYFILDQLETIFNL